MSTLSDIKKKRQITAVTIFLIFAALLTYSIMKPDPEEQAANEIKDMVLSVNPGKMTKAKRKEIRDMMNRLSPETKNKLIREIMRGRLEQMREETAGMTQAQKEAKVHEAVLKIRNRFSKMTPEQRNKAREQLNSPAGKQRMKQALEFYYTEFTPEERQLLDPVVEEISIQLGR